MRLSVLKMLQKGTVALPGTRVLLPPLSDDGCGLRAPARPRHAANARTAVLLHEVGREFLKALAGWLLTISQALTVSSLHKVHKKTKTKRNDKN